MRRPTQLRPGLQPAAVTFLCLLLATLPTPSCAHPYPKDDLHEAGFGYLMARGCNQYCGYDNQYCCREDTQCYTSDGIAGCSATAGGGGFAWYTSTWTVTETFTSTYSSDYPATTAPAGQECQPAKGSGQIACGNICCASWQYCAYKGQCMANPGGGGGGGGGSGPTSGGGGGGGGAGHTTVVSTSERVITTQYSAPYRVTSGATATQTSEPTGTQASATSTGTGGAGGVTTGGTAGKLSAGAIAGIVIGVLAGVGLLLLLCACCIMRGLWHGFLAIFGLGPKKRRRDSRGRESIIEEERYTRRGSVHSRRDTHGAWFGRRRPSSVVSRKEKRKSGGGGGWLGLGAAAGTLLLLLGLRRDNKRKSAKSRSEVSSSYYTDSYTTSNPSSMSSRPTRASRQSRGSRGTRTTRVTRSRVESRAGSRRP